MKDGVYIVKHVPGNVILLKGGKYIYLKHRHPYRVSQKHEYAFDAVFRPEDVYPISVKYYFDLITKDSI